eukprot:12126706-Alexandrium_andersonii.AAC.1
MFSFKITGGNTRLHMLSELVNPDPDPPRDSITFDFRTEEAGGDDGGGVSARTAEFVDSNYVFCSVVRRDPSKVHQQRGAPTAQLKTGSMA